MDPHINSYLTSQSIKTQPLLPLKITKKPAAYENEEEYKKYIKKPWKYAEKPVKYFENPGKYTEEPGKYAEKPLLPLKITTKPAAYENEDEYKKYTKKPWGYAEKPVEYFENPWKYTEEPGKYTQKPNKYTEKPEKYYPTLPPTGFPPSQ